MFALLLCLAAATADAGVIGVESVWEERPGGSLTANDILTITDLGGVAASPDGVHVAFVTRRADANCNCYHQALHLLNRGSGALRSVADLGQPFLSMDDDGSTVGMMMTAQPSWSPNGK